MSFGPPLVNVYGMISGLGQTFENSFDKARQNADQNAAAELYARQLQPTQTGAPNLASALMSSAQTQTQQALNQGTQGPTAGLDLNGKIPSFIQQAADATGASPTYLTRTAQIESGMNPNARNPSGAAGLFQFMPSTAKQYGLSNPLDPQASAMAAGRLASDNAGVLRSALGRDPTEGELYLAHQQGAGGATKLLANPNAPAESIVGRAAVVQNGGQPGMTAGQFASLWTGKFGGGQPMAMPQGGQQVAQAPMPPPRPQGIQIASADPNFAPQMPAAAANMTPAQILVSRAQQGGGATFPSANNPQGVRGIAPAPATEDDEEGGSAATDTTGSTKLAQAQTYRPGQIVFPGMPQPQAPAGPLPSGTGLQQLTDQQRGMLRQMLANPVTRPQAMQTIQQLMQPTKPEVKEVGGQLYAIDPRTQQARRIEGVGDNYERFSEDGTTFLRNKTTQQITVGAPSQKADKGDEYNALADARAKRAAALGMQPGAPDYQSFVATGKMPSARSLSPEQQAEQRAAAAQAQGLVPGTEAFRHYALTGQLQDPAKTAEMKATEQKMYAAEQQKTEILNQQIQDLSKALELNPKVYSGNYEPGTASWIARNVPGGTAIVDPERVVATSQYENLVGGATLSQGKELFGSRVTNYDEKLLQALKANPNMMPQERETIIKRMIEHRQQVLHETQQRAQEMKAGTYFKRGQGGASQGAQPASPAEAPRGLPAGAKQGTDGNYYVPDANRPGKYLRVDPNG